MNRVRQSRAERSAQPKQNSVLLAAFALLAGFLHAVSLAWPFATWFVPGFGTLQQGQSLWWLQLTAMSLLVGLLLRARRGVSAAWLGWLFSLAWLSLTFGWLYISMHRYGGLNAALAALAVLALSGALGLYYAAACWLVGVLTHKNKGLFALLFASSWLFAELARGQWLTGFGWGASAYAHADGPLANFLPWVGAYGVGWLAALVAALLALSCVLTKWLGKLSALTGAAGLLLVSTLLPAPGGAAHGGLQVTLLQGNIAQEEKFEAATGVLQALRWYGDALHGAQTDLVITPETALAVLPTQLPDGYWQALQQRFTQGKQAALVGIPLGDYATGYTNSIVGLKPGQDTPWRYDKQHLVPFGEFIPPLFRWFTDLMRIPLGDFNRGSPRQPTFDWRGQRLATTICYENLFSEELAQQFTDAAQAPTMLVNISNLGWFGAHLAMDQHLQIARLRAREFDRPFLLATNTGQTAIVDHRGVVIQRIAPHTATMLQGYVQGRSGRTPYAVWVSRWGQWPLWLLALGVVMLALLAKSAKSAQS